MSIVPPRSVWLKRNIGNKIAESQSYYTKLKK